MENNITKLKKLEEESFLGITYKFEKTSLKEQYSDLCSAFTTLKTSNKIWDITMAEQNFETKAAAGTSITRNEVSIDFIGANIIKSSEKILHFGNCNGGDLYFYTNFMIYFKNEQEIAIIDYNDIYLDFEEKRFLEESTTISKDTTQIGETWYRVNKDGAPDRRFLDNYKIPIVLYGALHFKTNTGINELYYISNHLNAKHFYEQFNNYKKEIIKTKIALEMETNNSSIAEEIKIAHNYS
jgi:hypothetical protein